MNGSSRVVAVMLFALSAASGTPCHAQGRNGAFQPMETTIEDIHIAFKSGLTARRLVQAYLDRIAAYDKQGPTINSIITLNDHALEDADRLDAAYKASGPIGPLHGIPVLVKDEIDTAGMPTTLGTQVFKDYRPPRDAFAIEKLREAGAIILGKLTIKHEDFKPGTGIPRKTTVQLTMIDLHMGCAAAGNAPLGTGSSNGGTEP